jgi:hypothetical protein
MFVGEGPGADEDAQGLPFVGKRRATAQQHDRRHGPQARGVYIANVVKCRPPGNRTPEPDEANTCSPFLFRQIDVVRPQVLVALGATHFIGIGGIGMSGIAEILLSLGMKVSGSDLRRGPVTDRLASWAPPSTKATTRPTSPAPRSSSPARRSAQQSRSVEAHARKIPVIQRAEMLAELMRLKYGIAIAGMHGKTTTTSMVASVLAAGGLDPTVVVGGRVDALGSNARLGTTQYLVAEADESDRSFLKLSPILAVVTNLDREHMDCYRDMADVERAFLDFMDKVPFYGAVTACIDNPLLKAILPRARRRVFTYGVAAEADFPLEFRPGRQGNRFARFLVHTAKGPLGPFELHVPGRHNVLNATAAVAIARQLEVPGKDRRGAQPLSRRRPPLPAARPGARRHRGRRLRPPSHRDSRHPGRRPRVRPQAHPRRLPAPPVHAHS